jgi:transcriptional regulator with XRE-family HTH domain
MPMKSNPQGPTGARVVENIAEFRRIRGLSKAELSRRLADAGRPMSLDVLTKVEQGKRAIDVDDLVTLATVLDTTPGRLLLTGTAGESAVELTPEHAVTGAEAWSWALGEQPLGFTNDHDGRVRKARFRAESKPSQAPESTVGAIGPFWDELAAASQVLAAVARKSGLPAASVLGAVDYMLGKRLEVPEPDAPDPQA